MPNTITITQEVKLFLDSDVLGVQEVSIDPLDDEGIWLSVSHDGNGFSMLLINWDSLVELVELAKKKTLKTNQNEKAIIRLQGK